MKHVKFLMVCILLPFINWQAKHTAKWVYTKITWRQFYLMVYKDMERIEAAKYIKSNPLIRLGV